MCQVVAPSWIRTEVIGLHDGVDMSLKCNRTVCVGVRSSENDRRVVRNHNSKTVSRVNEKSFVSSVFFRFHLNFYWFSRSHALSHSTISERKWIDKREKKKQLLTTIWYRSGLIKIQPENGDLRQKRFNWMCLFFCAIVQSKHIHFVCILSVCASASAK